MQPTIKRYGILNSPAIFIVGILFFIGIFNATILPGVGSVFNFVFYIMCFFFPLYILFSPENSFFNPRIPKITLSNFLFGLTVFFFTVSIILNLGSESTLKSILKLTGYFIVIYIFFFDFSGKMVDDRKLFDKFVSITIAGLSCLSIFSLLALFMGISLNTIYPKMAAGIFMHPNTMGVIYTILLPSILYKIFNNSRGRMMLWFLFLICLIALLFTFSRASYLASCIACMAMVYSKSKKVLVFGIILTAVFFFLFAIDFVASKEDSSISRIILWATAYDMLVRDTHHMLWGYGVYNALDVFVNEKFFFGSREVVPDPHNSFLLFSIQFGLMFSVSLTVFIISIYYTIFKKRKSESFKELRSNLFLAAAISVSLLLQNLVENILVYPEYFVMLFYLTFLGYLYNYNKLKKPV